MHPISVIGKSIPKPKPAPRPGNNGAGANRKKAHRAPAARLIETYFHAGPGYEPFLVRAGGLRGSGQLPDCKTIPLQSKSKEA